MTGEQPVNPQASVEIVIRLQFGNNAPTEHAVSNGTIEPGTTMGEFMAGIAEGLRGVADDIAQQGAQAGNPGYMHSDTPVNSRTSDLINGSARQRG